MQVLMLMLMLMLMLIISNGRWLPCPAWVSM